MSLLLSAVFVSAAYVAGCLTGHQVVTAVKTEFAKLHEKLDSLISKKVNTVQPLHHDSKPAAVSASHDSATGTGHPRLHVRHS
jgi:outer membrane murein-binding lipoprotein Lpp